MLRVMVVLLGLGLLTTPAVDAASSRKNHRVVKKQKSPVPRCRDVFCTAQVLRLDGSTAEVKGLTEEQVEQVMQSQRPRLSPCLVDARRKDPTKRQVRLEFVVTGGGKVLAARVDGKRYSELARCLTKQMTGIRFPTSSRPRMVAAVTLAVPQ